MTSFLRGFSFPASHVPYLELRKSAPASLKCQQAQIKNVSTKVALSTGGTCRGQARRTENT